MKEKTLFGIYHTDYRKNGERYKALLKEDFLNTFLVEGGFADKDFEKNFEALPTDADKAIWVSVSDLGFYHEHHQVADVGEETHTPISYLYADFEARVDRFITYLKEKDFYRHVVGFYMDEPMLHGVTNAQLKAFTGYFRTVAATDKRFFICFSLAGVAPEYWTIAGAEAITPDSAQYLTDIAFDMYHPWSEAYLGIYAKMLERVGRKDIRVWFVPCTMDYRGDKTEEHCLEHLENCYALLKQADNPGGLMCYTYHTFPAEIEALGNVGLDRLTDPTYPKDWKRLYDRIREIGREIVSEN